MNDEARPDWLEHHLSRLPKEIAPQHDLWPVIATRLQGNGIAPQWLAVAATLLLSAGLAVFGWQAYRAAESERMATEILIGELLAPYTEIQAEHAKRWLELGMTLEPNALAALADDRRTIERARATLTQALIARPGDPTLHRLMQQVMAQDADLLEAGTRVAGYRL